MTMPNPSLDGLACRPASLPTLGRLVGAERALVFVCISFALRGAPCGNDAWLVTTIGGYHGQEATPKVATDRDESGLLERVFLIKPLDPERVPERHNRFVEADAVLPDILGLFGGVTTVLDHTPDTTDRLSPATYFGIGARTTRPPHRRQPGEHPDRRDAVARRDDGQSGRVSICAASPADLTN